MSVRARKLLLVEDQALIAMTQKMQLETVGYEVDHVLTGEAAVTEALACDSRPDLILMDIDLGSGIDGTEAAEQILSRIEIPIVFLSSHTDPKVVEKTERITSYGYVVKNSGLTVLDASIKMAFKLFEAKQQHAKSEEEYRRLFNTMPTGVVHQLPDGTIVSVNAAAEKMLGSDLTEMIGTQSKASSWKMIDEYGNPVPDYEDPVMRACQTGESVGPLERGVFVPEKNRYTWLKITATPLFNPGEDRPYQSYATLEDITAQKHAETESNRRDLLVQKILDHSVDLIAIVDLNGRFQFVSRSHDILGYDVADLVGTASIDYVHPDDRAALNDVFGRIVEFQEQRTGEYRYRTSTGEYLWFETTGTVLTRDDGTPEQILLSTRDITERKTAEHAAACAIEDQRILLDNVPTQIWYLTDITMYGRVNEAHARFLGFQKEDLAFRDMSDRLTADVVAACQLSNRRVFETCQTVVSEEWVPDASGEPRLLSITKTPQVNDQGNVEYVVCAADDITVRTQWEDEAKDHEALLQKILDNTVDLIAIFDLDGSIKAVSRSHELLGYDLQSIVGSSATDFVHPDDAEAMVRAIRDIPSLQETRISEYRLLRSESDYVWVETHETVLRDADGNPQQLLVNARDISTRKRMEEALRQREQYYRSIYNSLRDAIIVVDENRTIIDCNTAFTELFGYHLSDVYGSSTAFLYSSPEEEKQLGRMMREHTDDAAFMFQPQYRNKAGAVFPGEKKIQLLKDEHGNQKGFVGVIRDISERKRSEEEVQRQLAEKEILLKEVHHRIKNNMAQVESMLSLQAASSGIPQVQSALKEATSRVRSIRALYEKLLVGTDYADVSMKAYLESLIDSLKEVYDEHSAISLRRTIEDFSLASKDAISVGIMVNELLTNVFKYAFAGRSGGEVFIDLENTDSQVTLTIKDDGVGLDRATVASKSTGFGLSIVTMLVEQFDGTFTMESDNGTTSTVAFDAMHSKNAYSQ